MSRNLLNALFGSLLVGFVAMSPAASSAGHLGQSQVANGMAIYLGVMPAERLTEHPDWYPAHERSKIPSGKNIYHVMLALFSHSTGKRITNADVEVRVSLLGLSGQKKHLDPTLVAGVITYCNYFMLSPQETYVVRAQIRLPGVPHPIHANFVLASHAD